MGKSTDFKLIILGQEDLFVQEVCNIVSKRHHSACVPLQSYADFEAHLMHSIPPDGIIVQTGHPEYHLMHDFIKRNALEILMISFAESDLIVKIDAFVESLKKWFTSVPYLPLHSDLAGFVGYTPVGLYLKEGDDYTLVIPEKSFVSEEGVKVFFSKGDGFFFIRREDRDSYEEDWEESTMAYFKADALGSIKQNGPLGLIIPLLESSSYHGIPEGDRKLLFGALERVAHFLQNNPELSIYIEETLKKSQYQLKHTTFLMCMNTAAMSALGLGSAVVYFNLTLASLIHDLGTMEYGFEEYEFHEYAMNGMLEEEVNSAYARHGEASISLLLQYRVCPRWLAEMVLSHHENDRGEGYPLGINSSSLGLATFIFSFNHEWAEKLYGAIARSSQKVTREFLISCMPESTVRSGQLKEKLLRHLQATLLR